MRMAMLVGIVLAALEGDSLMLVRNRGPRSSCEHVVG